MYLNTIVFIAISIGEEDNYIYNIHCILQLHRSLTYEIVSIVDSKTGSKNSVLAFLKCMGGTVLDFLKCMDGSLLVFLKCICPPQESGFPSIMPPLDFHSPGVLVYHSYYAR